MWIGPGPRATSDEMPSEERRALSPQGLTRVSLACGCAVNVSKGMNHLLKSPWCAHPKTGRVCVPLDPEAAADFDPSQVPTLRMVADELDAAHKAGAEMGKGRDISSTRLGKYEAAFEDFLRRSENTVRGERLRAGKETASLDF